MSKKEDIQYHFRIAVKNAAIDISNRILDYPGSRKAYLNQFSTRLDALIEERDKSLAELETVGIELRHLVALRKFIRLAAREIGVKPGEHEWFDSRSCFGKSELCGMCGDELGQACAAVGKLLKDDC